MHLSHFYIFHAESPQIMSLAVPSFPNSACGDLSTLLRVIVIFFLTRFEQSCERFGSYVPRSTLNYFISSKLAQYSSLNPFFSFLSDMTMYSLLLSDSHPLSGLSAFFFASSSAPSLPSIHLHL